MTKNGKKRLIVFYDFFYPAYKAGGPIQSITNLCRLLATELDIFVVCNACDIDGTPLENIEVDKWNTIFGVQVYYLSQKQKKQQIVSIIKSLQADLFYINGIFSVDLSILPLILWHLLFKNKVKLILSPRGMLQQTALNQKRLKKSIFLNLFKFFRLQSRVHWHATDAKEKADIQLHFGKNKAINIISNIPKIPVASLIPISKLPGTLKIVFISLITEMKNLVIALQYLRELDLPISFDIYGPVKEADYWELCKKEIAIMPGHVVVNYHGDLQPEMVQDTFSRYHLFFLPTKGENFGHAIYECLSVGRPVLISNNTPWKKLEENKAGFDIAVNDKAGFHTALRVFFEMDGTKYVEWCDGAWQVATIFWRTHDFKTEYLELFN